MLVTLLYFCVSIPCKVNVMTEGSFCEEALLRTPEPHDLQKKHNEETVPYTDKPFVQQSEK